MHKGYSTGTSARQCESRPRNCRSAAAGQHGPAQTWIRVTMICAAKSARESSLSTRDGHGQLSTSDLVPPAAARHGELGPESGAVTVA